MRGIFGTGRTREETLLAPAAWLPRRIAIPPGVLIGDLGPWAGRRER
jgi:hypothetical protein